MSSENMPENMSTVLPDILCRNNPGSKFKKKVKINTRVYLLYISKVLLKSFLFYRVLD